MLGKPIQTAPRKPCPFCNHHAVETVRVEVATFSSAIYRCTCANCDAIGPMGKDPEQAAYFWNVRERFQPLRV